VATLSNHLFIGIGGHAVALDVGTGEELWRTKLKGGSGTATTVAIIAGKLYAGSGGEVFRLDLSTGQILWRNKLPGLGLGVLAFCGSDAIVAADAEQQQADAATAAT